MFVFQTPEKQKRKIESLNKNPKQDHWASLCPLPARNTPPALIQTRGNNRLKESGVLSSMTPLAWHTHKNVRECSKTHTYKASPSNAWPEPNERISWNCPKQFITHLDVQTGNASLQFVDTHIYVRDLKQKGLEFSVRIWGTEKSLCALCMVYDPRSYVRICEDTASAISSSSLPSEYKSQSLCPYFLSPPPNIKLLISYRYINRFPYPACGWITSKNPWSTIHQKTQHVP